MSINGSVLLADDVRIEAGGKLIIVGMYTNDIQIAADPFYVSSFWAVFAIDEMALNRLPSITFETTFPGEDAKVRTLPLSWPPLPAVGGPTERDRWSIRYAVPLGFTTLRPGPIASAVIYGDQRTEFTPHWVRYTGPEQPQA